MLASLKEFRLVRQIALATMTTLAALSIAHAAPPAAPTVIGPLPFNSTPGAGLTRDYPQLATEPYFDLKLVGYTEEEFFVQGFATRYETPALARGVALSTGHPYKTRIVVHRPVDPAKFNGIVLVEWDNVTSGYGIDLHWEYSREYLTREGYVHVRVQAQRVGVHQARSGLKEWSPTRYASLDLTAGGTILDDSLSYDVFSQVVVALKGFGQSQLLGNLRPKAFLAVGQSQSASRLTLYYNSIQPIHKVVDGFLLQVSGGPFRTDINAPLIQVLSENEVQTGGYANRRQPDSGTYRRWEVAGAAHVDYWWVMYRQALAVRDGLTPPSLACQPEPASHVPLRYVLNAGYHHLARWVLRNEQPPRAPDLVTTSLSPVVLARDENGIALGGIRQPEVEAPTATNMGIQINMTPGCPGNYGMHIPFSEAKLSQLYPTERSYERAVTQSVRRNVRDGFLLKEDGEEIIQRARNSTVGTGRPVMIH
ncbi:hypothetical protein HQN59_19570 [Schlegelella sp. ID0723]|uniref:Alpha/beta hydrolase domain-containing protein n=2 Tax=Piscinibacter koreensis TaxID=2742824 RepID=A0A7Y6TY84_9BURK|nr:hypothetical protein [Schlegelella koreensis]